MRYRPSLLRAPSETNLRRARARLFAIKERIADEHQLSKKTYNNSFSVLRRAFKFGYGDHPDRHNPTTALESVRIRKKERPAIDPFPIQEAETLIAALHRELGEAQGR